MSEDHVIHLGDCLDPLRGLATLADKSAGLCLTDPPYSAKVHHASRRGSMTPEPGKGKAAFCRNRDLAFDHLTAAVRWAAALEFGRLAQRWVLVFCDIEGADGWRNDLESAGLNYVRTGAWVKEGATPQFTGDRPAVGFEAVVIAHAREAGRYHWNGGGRHAVWSVPIVLDRGGNEPRLHTTQKPLSLLEQLVSDFSDPGEVVVDPFAGSGTTLVACKRLGRRAIGWEKDATFWERAVRRLENTKQQYELLPRGPKPRQQKMVLP